MRLRHKKNAEQDILKSPICLNSIKSIGARLCNTTVWTKLGETNVGANNASPISSKEIFNNSNPLHLELGMGKGKFITKISIKNKDINFIGIEKSASIIMKAKDNLVELCDNQFPVNELNEPDLLSIYPNLRFLCADIQFLDIIFLPHSIDKIYLNFSDPWPKEKHKHRRLTHHYFLSIYEKILKENSILEFKTDNIDLFNFTLEEIKHSNFKLLEYTYDLHNDEDLNVENIMTEYEEKFSALGNRICKLIAKI